MLQAEYLPRRLHLFVGLLYHRLMQRGWGRIFVHEIVLEATSKAENKPINPPPITTDAKKLKDNIFLHFQFHRDRISRQDTRKYFEEHLEQICKNELKTERMIVTFSRPKNIGDFVTRAKLHQAPGKSISTILGEFKDGLNPY